MRKNEYLLSQDFFEETVDEFRKTDQRTKKLIIVEHAVVNSLDFLKYLSDCYDVYFIPKPKSIDENVVNELSKVCTVLNVRRDELASDTAVNLLKKIVGNEPFAIVDIGGYFSKQIENICNFFGEQLTKVIEDTENGYQKYEEQLKTRVIDVPILSVARSPLKLEEDYLVGHEIVIKSEIFLADYGTTLLGKKALVIGFGKIGHSIAESLRNRGVIVYVNDHKSIRQANALAHGFNFVSDFYDKIPEIDIVYIANGEKSIDIQKLKNIKLNHILYSFSVTSSEDTFQSSNLINGLEKHGHNVEYRILKTKNNRDIILANSGNAINFTYTISTLSEYVQLTQAEMAVMLKSTYSRKGVILEMEQKSRELIASKWLKFVYEKREFE